MISPQRPWSFRRSTLLLLIIAGVMGRGAGAQAPREERPADEARVPSLVGASGLLRVPSAYVQRGDEVAAFGAWTSHETSGGLLVGLANRLEFGATVRSRERGGSQVVGNAKLNLVSEQLFSPAVSIGIADAFGSGSQASSGYVVVSKDIIPYFVEALTGQRRLALKLHMGFGGGLYGHTLFTGAELVGDGGLSGFGEIVRRRVNLGIRYTHQGFAATVGWLDLKDADGSLSYAIALR
jgi:hypothetical protein